MGKLCENQQEIYAAYQVANLLGVYEDCSPNGFYQRWKQKNAFMKAQAEEFGIGSTDHFIDAIDGTMFFKYNNIRFLEYLYSILLIYGWDFYFR